jgi:hypothetical protein
MENEFVNRLKKIENELLALKTASEYSSMRTAYTAPIVRVTTGLYRVNYATDGQAILSQFYRQSDDTPCGIYERTPSTSSQVLEINTTVWDNTQQQYITYENGVRIVSNVPVVSITRIS